MPLFFFFLFSGSFEVREISFCSFGSSSDFISSFCSDSDFISGFISSFGDSAKSFSNLGSSFRDSEVSFSCLGSSSGFFDSSCDLIFDEASFDSMGSICFLCPFLPFLCFLVSSSFPSFLISSTFGSFISSFLSSLSLIISLNGSSFTFTIVVS